MAFRFDTAPQRIYWELTRACDLACTHCRANADRIVDPRELTAPEIARVVDAIASHVAPTIIFTGGDPLKRADFFDIISHAASAGLPCLVAPSATPLLTSEVISRLASLRVGAMSLSLDGSHPARHDALRGVAGTFDRTLHAAREIVKAGIPLQINTLVTADTIGDLPAIHSLVGHTGAERWSLFFLIATGRGRLLRQITPEQADAVMNWVLDNRGRKPMITTTEAPHFRRIQLVRRLTRCVSGQQGRARVQGLGIRDGNGVMFISHTGDIQPSGFLPLTAGNVRAADPVNVYRESPIFRSLRRTDLFKGRCGCCPFRDVCGGSRARAYAMTGDPLECDPLCSYTPATAHTRPSPAPR
jgi:radical SAM protein